MSLHAVDDIDPPECTHDVAIGIPACNEAASMSDCLAAIDTSAGRTFPSRVTTIVFVNNSSDATAAIARAYQARHITVSVVEAELGTADAHAGGARRRALDLALALLPETGVLMTTDADSCVHADWIAANLAEIEAGADAVAGTVTFSPNAHVQVSPSRNAEWHLAHLHARLHSLLDPRPQDRWPTHIWAWGASLAVTARAYRSIGGLPEIPLAEDRALAEALDRSGFRVRRSHAPIVFTSHRSRGRAPGGLADLLSSYVDDEDFPCDAALEPTTNLVRRLAWRAHLRNRHAEHGPRVCDRMMRRLGMDPHRDSLHDVNDFGNWWSLIENVSPGLQRERVEPVMLATEISRAARLIRLIESVQARRAGNPTFARVAGL